MQRTKVIVDYDFVPDEQQKMAKKKPTEKEATAKVPELEAMEVDEEPATVSTVKKRKGKKADGEWVCG
jgi:hypothetical protein